MSTPATMTDAIVRVDLSDTVWFLLDGRGSFRRKSLFLAEIGALRAFLKSMVQIVVIGDSTPGDLVAGRYSAAARDCRSRFPMCAAPSVIAAPTPMKISANVRMNSAADPRAELIAVSVTDNYLNMASRANLQISPVWHLVTSRAFGCQ